MNAPANRVTSVSTPLHHGGRLTLDAPRDAEGARIVELFATSLDSGGPLDLGVQAFKLVDSRSSKPIADTVVRLTFREKESVELKTNSLGYVFVPGEKIVEALDDVDCARAVYDMAREATAADINANYRGNYERLVGIKTKYDPTNLFRLNANVQPTKA